MKTSACNRINALLDKVEAALKQALRIAATQENLKPDADFGALANLLRCYVVGRWEQYARSGFSREPLTQWPQQWPMLYFACLSQSGAPGSPKKKGGQGRPFPQRMPLTSALQILRRIQCEVGQDAISPGPLEGQQTFQHAGLLHPASHSVRQPSASRTHRSPDRHRSAP
jgi:hypothetical protein